MAQQKVDMQTRNITNLEQVDAKQVENKQALFVENENCSRDQR